MSSCVVCWLVVCLKKGKMVVCACTCMHACVCACIHVCICESVPHKKMVDISLEHEYTEVKVALPRLKHCQMHNLSKS